MLITSKSKTSLIEVCLVLALIGSVVSSGIGNETNYSEGNSTWNNTEWNETTEVAYNQTMGNYTGGDWGNQSMSDYSYPGASFEDYNSSMGASYGPWSY